MFVWHPAGLSRRPRFRLPPALFGVVAVLAVGIGAMAQVRSAEGWSGSTRATLGQAALLGQAAPAPVAPAAPASQPAQTSSVQDPTLFELFKKGGPVMWILAASSVLSLAIIFERIYALRRSTVIPPGFLPGLKNVYRDPIEDRERALAYCQQNDSPMARMVLAFVKRLPRGVNAAEKAVEDAGGNEALRLRANLRVFYAIGSVATLLGLIGTIAGMIKAFMVTARAGDAGNKVELLSTGIYEAMVCTFGGLTVATLVTIFYYYFIGRIEKLITEINDELTRFADEYGVLPESSDELSTTSAMPRL